MKVIPSFNLINVLQIIILNPLKIMISPIYYVLKFQTFIMNEILTQSFPLWLEFVGVALVVTE